MARDGTDEQLRGMTLAAAKRHERAVQFFKRH